MIIRRTFEEQLQELQDDMLRLGRFVEEALSKSMEALAKQDFTLAKQVIADDDFADDMDFGIQARAMQLLALQQPMARDLRMVGASLRIVVDLERIGDHAVDIAKFVRSLAGQTYSKPLADMAKLGDLSRKMVGDALQAFVNHDIELAVQVARDDDAVDDLCDYVQNELLSQMRDDPTRVEQCTRLLLVARNLERVADHATNMVEYIYYVETGQMRQLAREEHGHEALMEIETAERNAVMGRGVLDHHQREIKTSETGVALMGNLPDGENFKNGSSGHESKT